MALTADVKALLFTAALAEGTSMSAFVRNAICERAARTLARGVGPEQVSRDGRPA